VAPDGKCFEPAAQRPRVIVESELHDPEAKLQAAGADLDIDASTITQMREAVMRVRDELKTLKLQAAAVDADVDLATILQMRMAVQSLRDELKTLMPEPAAQPEPAALVSMTARELSVKISLWLEKRFLKILYGWKSP
jgi:hypothetical protein